MKEEYKKNIWDKQDAGSRQKRNADQNYINAYPKMPNGFHDRLESVVNQECAKAQEGVQIDMQEQKNTTRRVHVSVRRVAVISAAAVVMLGGTVFASDAIIRKNKEYSEKVSQVDSYAYNLEVNEKEAEQSSDAVVVTEHSANFHAPVKLSFGYMIDGYQGKMKFAYNGQHADGSGRAFSVELQKYDDRSMVQLDNVMSISDIELNGVKGYWIYVNDLRTDGYDRRVMLFNDEYGYAVCIYVGCNVPDEEILKVAENISLTVCDESEATESGNQWTVEGIAKREEERAYFREHNKEEMAGASTTTDGSVFHRMNETFAGVGTVERVSMSNVDYTIENVTIADDISMLDTSNLSGTARIGLVTDASGKLLPCERKLVKSGDRVSTVDQEIKTEKIGRKLVYVTMKMKNTTDTDISSVKAGMSLVSLKKQDGVYTTNLLEDGFSYLRDINMGGTIYSDSEPVDLGDGHFAEGFTPLAAGEEKIVHYAFIVDEDQIDTMMLSYKSACNVNFNAEDDAFVLIAE